MNSVLSVDQYSSIRLTLLVINLKFVIEWNTMQYNTIQYNTKIRHKQNTT